MSAPQGSYAKELDTSALLSTIDTNSFASFLTSTSLILDSTVGRPEIQFLMLLGDYVYSRSSTGLLGRVVVVSNGVSVCNWAWRLGLTKPLEAWDLKGVSASSSAVSWFALFCFGLSGAKTVYAGLVGPEKHPLTILGLGIEKLALVSQLLMTVKSDPSLVHNSELNAFMKSQMRSGTILTLLSFYLMYRARDSSSKPPEYIYELEQRLNSKIDKLTTVAKDQRSLLSTIRGQSPGPPGTPSGASLVTPRK